MNKKTLSYTLGCTVCRNGSLLTGKALFLSHVSSCVNMASEKIWTLMNSSGILRDVK